jgi:hypothetical protein
VKTILRPVFQTSSRLSSFPNVPFIQWVEFLERSSITSHIQCVFFTIILVPHITFYFSLPTNSNYGDKLELPLMWCFFFNLKLLRLLTLFFRSWYIYIYIQFCGFESLDNFSKFLVFFIYQKIQFF